MFDVDGEAGGRAGVWGDDVGGDPRFHQLYASFEVKDRRGCSVSVNERMKQMYGRCVSWMVGWPRGSAAMEGSLEGGHILGQTWGILARQRVLAPLSST